MARLGHAARQMHGSAQADCAYTLSCLVNLLLHERCELFLAVHVQLGVDAAGVGSDGVNRHHFAVGDLLGGSAAGKAQEHLGFTGGQARGACDLLAGKLPSAWLPGCADA